MPADKPKKKLLGEYLVDEGLVKPDQIQQALEEQKKAGSRLGQMLIDLGFINEDDLIIALARQLGLAHIDIASYQIKPEVVKLIPENVARRYELIAINNIFGHDAELSQCADPLRFIFT